MSASIVAVVAMYAAFLLVGWLASRLADGGTAAAIPAPHPVGATS